MLNFDQTCDLGNSMNEVFKNDTENMTVEEKVDYLISYYRKYKKVPDNIGMFVVAKNYKRNKNQKEMSLSPVTTFYALHLLQINKYVSNTFTPLLFSIKGSTMYLSDVTEKMKGVFLNYFVDARWLIVPSVLRRSMAKMVDGLCVFGNVSNGIQSRANFMAKEILKTGSKMLDNYYKGDLINVKNNILKNTISEITFVLGEGAELSPKLVNDLLIKSVMKERGSYYSQIANVKYVESGKEQNAEIKPVVIVENNNNDLERENIILIENYRKKFGSIPDTENFTAIELKSEQQKEQDELSKDWLDNLKNKLHLMVKVCDKILDVEDKNLKIDTELVDKYLKMQFLLGYDIIQILDCDEKLVFFQVVVKQSEGITKLNHNNIRKLKLNVLGDFIFKKIKEEFDGDFILDDWGYLFKEKFIALSNVLQTCVITFKKNQVEKGNDLKSTYCKISDFVKMLSVKTYAENCFRNQAKIHLKKTKDKK